jgi:hypothetical protein
MNEVACQYTIVRFLPYAETGEFANVGIILACPETGFIGGKVVALNRTKRITDFFDDLQAKIYKEGVKYIREEITRVRNFIAHLPGDRARITSAAFHELARPREALIRCSPVRAVLATDPKAELERLFGHFVERDFVTKEYQEELLTKGVGRLLATASLRGLFDKGIVGDDAISVRFPFVSRQTSTEAMAIKPLDLAKAEASKVIDHGGPWVDKVRRLKKHGLLPKVLFAVDCPASGRQLLAAKEIVGDLESLGVQVTNIKNEQEILKFADQARTLR